MEFDARTYAMLMAMFRLPILVTYTDGTTAVLKLSGVEL